MNANNRGQLIKLIAEENKLSFSSCRELSGGDINEVFLLISGTEKFVIKLNQANRFPGMFEAEKLGLEYLAKPGVIDIPKPITTGRINSMAYLLLEYRETGSKTRDFWDVFGRQLAELHQVSSGSFGLEQDNYIGSLQQHNRKESKAADFYINSRLIPQIEMAEEKGFDLQVSDNFYKNCRDIIPDEVPALIHGDLWNGNYLVNSEGNPCLIDPAVAYAPREMDLGMMKLFGGFDENLFEVYHENFPLQGGWKERLPIWQLYYLLVHLNIFGAGYRSQVNSIIRQFS
ncbi:fructosamine kinase family protein [Gramella sp. GC03-9]|uniref:Fructosamine kinase family protein n=1 Tax=Christiangramia oceanisediminis TaxID=2920386 RepID=A0A9X2I0T6_9FLAO|nr:fructosamine kinase family protein [Gramella oceanisediminis]MCP9198560.1 fructosamine kinase family protein [Gramella oceanisediminis]